jgi:hypothetical protein
MTRLPSAYVTPPNSSAAETWRFDVASGQRYIRELEVQEADTANDNQKARRRAEIQAKDMQVFQSKNEMLEREKGGQARQIEDLSQMLASATLSEEPKRVMPNVEKVVKAEGVCPHWSPTGHCKFISKCTQGSHPIKCLQR